MVPRPPPLTLVSTTLLSSVKRQVTPLPGNIWPSACSGVMLPFTSLLERPASVA